MCINLIQTFKILVNQNFRLNDHILQKYFILVSRVSGRFSERGCSNNDFWFHTRSGAKKESDWVEILWNKKAPFTVHIDDSAETVAQSISQEQKVF